MSPAVQPLQAAAIGQYAKQLHLPTMGSQFARLAEQAVKEQQSHLSYLEALLEGEVEERGRKVMARRIQEARFPTVKTLEEFDFQCAPHLPVMLLRDLSEGGYLERKEPIIFLGDPILRHSAPPCYIAEINRYSSVGFRPTALTFLTSILQYPPRISANITGYPFFAQSVGGASRGRLPAQPPQTRSPLSESPRVPTARLE